LGTRIELANANGKTITLSNTDGNTESSADLEVSKLPLSLESLDELRNKKGFNNQSVLVKSTGSIYSFVDVAEDESLPYTVAGANGVWKLKLSGLLDIKMFDAKGDGVTDDTVAFELASKHKVVVSEGNYVINKLINGNFVVDSKATFENMPVVDNTERLELGRTSNLCSFDMEQTAGTGNLQGIVINDNKLYAYKNVKNIGTGINSYHPDESGKVFEFEFKDDGSELVKIGETSIDKFGHQQLSHFIEDDKLFLVNSGGTPDSDTATDITTYSGVLKEDIYPNAGKEIAIYDVENGTNTLIRVMAEYDANDKDTKWYHSVPYATKDGKVLVVVFSDIYYTPRKIVRFFDFEKLRSGEHTYLDFYNEISLDLKIVDVTEYNAFQGLMYANGRLFLQYGYYQPSFNKMIIELEESGTFVKKHKLFPSFIDENNYSVVELEGMCTYGDKLVSGLNTRDTNGNYMCHLILHGDGDYKGIGENLPPSALLSTLEIDNIIPEGEAYRIQTWDYDTEESELVHHITSAGNPQYRGTYLSMRATKESGDSFKPLSYNIDTQDRQLLQLRGWGKTLEEGAGINLYGANDSVVSNPDMHLFATNFRFKKTDDTDVLEITELGNIRAGSYVGFDWDGSTYNKVLNRNVNMLEIRAKDTLDNGAGINLYDKDHETKARQIVLFANNTDGGQIVFDDIPTADPSIAGAIWNDEGTLKVSAG